MTTAHEKAYEQGPPVASSVEYYRLPQNQDAFLHGALLEAKTIADPTKPIAGPLFTDFNAILRGVQSELNSLQIPNVTPEYLMPAGYQSTAVQRITTDQAAAITHLRRRRREELYKVANSKTLPTILDGPIPMGLLDIPPYHFQGETWTDDKEEKHKGPSRSSQACTNAGFRMVFDGIAGWVPLEEIVAKQMIHHRGSYKVHDEEYRKIFATQLFRNATGKKVAMREIIGADFSGITQITERIKKDVPGSQVFCLINIGSAKSAEEVWHTNILLYSDRLTVTVHDPSDENNGIRKQLHPESFAKRWAITCNRAQLFIAV